MGSASAKVESGTVKVSGISPEELLNDVCELPKGWSWKSLAEVAADGVPILYGILQPGPDTPGGVPYVRPTEIVEDVIDLSSIRRTTPAIAGKYKRSVLKPDDVILSIVGTIGKVAVVPPDLDGGNITQSSVRVRPRSEVVSPRYVAWVLRSPVLRRQFDKHRLGTAVPRLNVAHVRALRVPVPPLPEQRRIVAEIEKQFTRLEAGVAALRRVQANLKRYRAAVLKAACEGRLVPTETAWPQKQIATAIETMDQGWSPKCESEASASDTTWAVIKTTAIQNLRFLEDENKTLPAALKPRAHLELVPGDLLVTRAGPRSRVGVACLVKSTRPRLMLCDKAYRLRCKPAVAHPAFLELVLNAPHVQDEVNKLKTGISDSGVNLTQKRFGELLVPLPPLAEQTRIVAEVERRLSVVEELESVVTANLQRATRLRQSILQRAFTGELFEAGGMPYKT